MTQISKVLNLQSIPCPLNVVKCKLALEKLLSDEILIVHLDKGEPEEMVRNALKKMKYSFNTFEEDDETIKFRISHEN